MNYKLIIFDWDGTLMDSTHKISVCMQRAAQEVNIPKPSHEQVKQVIGLSLRQAIARLFSLQDEQPESHRLVDQIFQRYRAHYLKAEEVPCSLFAGVRRLLELLLERHQAMAIATGKARRGLQRALSDTDSGHFFCASKTADDAASKPSPDMLIALLNEQDLDVHHCVMIGDTTYDMQMAEAIGMDRIAVSYGAHTRSQLEEVSPTAIAHSVSELSSMLLTPVT